MLTEITTAAAERVQRWSADCWYELPRRIYWGKFIKTDDDAIIQERRDLEGQAGDRLNYTLINKATGQGVSDDDPLEGQEEELDPDTDSVTLGQRRNAIRLKGRLSMKRTAWDQEDASKAVLRSWMIETIDDDIFTKLSTSNTRVVYGGTATARNNLVVTGLITPARIDVCVARAQKADPKIWEVRVGGEDLFVLVIHTDCWYDLRQNSVWQGYQQNGAQVQGRDNPIFSGSPGVYNQVVIHRHEKVPAGTDAGAAGDVPYAANLFVGRQAGVIAYGARPNSWVKEFDYNNSVGMAIGAIWGMVKSQFNAVDHAVIDLEVARTNN